jgi:hypothetical protein
VEGMTDKEGKKYNAYITVNEEGKKLDFSSKNPDKKEKQETTTKKGHKI